MIRALAEWLTTQPGLTDLRVGNTLIIGPMLQADLEDDKRPEKRVILLERQGAPETLGAVGQARLQVLVREASLFKARDLALAVHRALHEVYNRRFEVRDATNAVIGNADVWAILADAEPASIGYDVRKLPEYSANYTITKTAA